MRGVLIPRAVSAAFLGHIIAWCAGCGPAAPPQATVLVPEVTVATPETAQLREYLYFTGRAVPAERVEIRHGSPGT